MAKTAKKDGGATAVADKPASPLDRIFEVPKPATGLKELPAASQDEAKANAELDEVQAPAPAAPPDVPAAVPDTTATDGAGGQTEEREAGMVLTARQLPLQPWQAPAATLDRVEDLARELYGRAIAGPRGQTKQPGHLAEEAFAAATVFYEVAAARRS